MTDQDPTLPTPRTSESPRNSIAKGMIAGFIILIGHLIFLVIPPAFIVAFFPGVSQWLIVAPSAIFWWRNGQRESAKGLLIFAAVVSLANAACCGLLMSSGF